MTVSETTEGSGPPATVSADFSTAHLPERERFAYFCDGICGTFIGIQPEPAGDTPFDASFRAIDFGTARLGIINAPAHRAVRDERLLSRVDDDCLYLNHMRSSQASVVHAGRRTLQRSGRTVLLDSTTPFELDITDEGGCFSLYSLRLERGLASRNRSDTMLEAVGHDLGHHSAAGAVIAEQMRLLVSTVASGHLAAAASMAMAIGMLIEALDCARREPAADARFQSIVELIEARLGDPSLSTASIARRLGCTARTIQAKFADRGTTPGAWVLKRRLERAKHMLDRPDLAFLSVATIAYRCGFIDPSHFSRAFRLHFGATPGSLRGDGATPGQSINDPLQPA